MALTSLSFSLDIGSETDDRPAYDCFQAMYVLPGLILASAASVAGLSADAGGKGGATKAGPVATPANNPLLKESQASFRA